MNKIIIAFILIFAVSCSSIKLKDKTLTVEYLENNDYTLIKNLHNIDSIKIKGNWISVKFNQPNHGIHLANNDILINFFANPKNQEMCYNKRMTNEKFFKCYEADRLSFWENTLNYKCNVQQKEDLFSIYLFDGEETILIGVKDKNTYFITLKAPALISQQEKNQTLTNIYNNLQ